MKLTPIAASIIPFFFCSLAFGYAADSTPPKLFYCPEKIECTEDKNPKSCKAIGGSSEYWDRVEGDSYRKGVYLLNTVYASKNLIEGIRRPCHYSNAERESILYVKSKYGSSYGPYFERSNKWTDTMIGPRCYAADTLLCPLAVNSVFSIYGDIHFEDIYRELVTYYIEIEVNGSIFKAERMPDMYISYQHALNLCGNVKECTFNVKVILSSTSMYIPINGKVTIDLEDRMKILKIEQLPDPYREKPLVNMLQDKPFNTIKFERNKS